MAQFRAIIKGQRGEASRLGSKNSGMHVECNGWSKGITVRATHENGKDYFQVYVTNGSSASRKETLVLTITENGTVVVNPDFPATN